MLRSNVRAADSPLGAGPSAEPRSPTDVGFRDQSPDARRPRSGQNGAIATRPARVRRVDSSRLGSRESDSPTRHWGVPLTVVVIGMFMSVLDTSIVSVAVPTIQKEYGVTTSDIQWITTAYTLCLGVVVPTSAWLGERLGLRRMYLLSLVSFSAFSALCGTAGDLTSMVFFRILQAIPGGMLPVTCLTILYRMVPKEKIGTAMGLYGLGIVFAPGVGPTLGGYLVEYVNWRLIFYINVPIGVLGALAAIAVLPSFPGARGRRFDLPGFVCIAAGLFALLLSLSEGQSWGWTSYSVLILTAVGINLLVLFVGVELQVKEPLLDVRVFTNWPFVNSLILISIMSIGLFAVLFYIPLFLQEGQGLTPWQTGLAVLPQALVMAVVMPWGGRIYDRFGPRWPATIGLLLAGGGTLLLTKINIDMTLPEMKVWMMIRAAGLGLGMMPIMTGGISALPTEIVGSGSAFNTLIQRVTAALGLAVLTGLATSKQAQFMADRSALLGSEGADPQILRMREQGSSALLPLWQRLQVEVEAQAFSDVFLVAGVCTLAGVLLAFFLRSGKASGGGADTEPVEIG
ncbi:MAG: multidrug efflux MFS transporter [Pseudonocardia sp.]|nr:multidrug efflux MFS transporter [Pseudonocardia sp.]